MQGWTILAIAWTAPTDVYIYVYLFSFVAAARVGQLSPVAPPFERLQHAALADLAIKHCS